MPDQEQLDECLGALEALHGSAGNGKLRELLGWDEGSSGAVKTELVAKRILVTGRERGDAATSLSGRTFWLARQDLPPLAGLLQRPSATHLCSPTQASRTILRWGA